MTRTRCLAILFAFLLQSPADSWAAKSFRVVVFGDSLTSGYQLQEQDAFPAQLERKIRASGYDPIEVINLSKPDATSASASAETNLVRETLPDVVIVQLGFNDAKRGVIPSAILFNISNIIADIKRTGAYVILVGTFAPSNMGDAYNNTIMENYYDIASKQGVALYPSALEGISDNPAMTLADGLHPNTSGVAAMVEGIFPLVKGGLDWRAELYQSEIEHSKTPGVHAISPPAP